MKHCENSNEQGLIEKCKIIHDGKTYSGAHVQGKASFKIIVYLMAHKGIYGSCFGCYFLFLPTELEAPQSVVQVCCINHYISSI